MEAAAAAGPKLGCSLASGRSEVQLKEQSPRRLCRVKEEERAGCLHGYIPEKCKSTPQPSWPPDGRMECLPEVIAQVHSEQKSFDKWDRPAHCAQISPRHYQVFLTDVCAGLSL